MWRGLLLIAATAHVVFLRSSAERSSVQGQAPVIEEELHAKDVASQELPPKAHDLFWWQTAQRGKDRPPNEVMAGPEKIAEDLDDGNLKDGDEDEVVGESPDHLLKQLEHFYNPKDGIMVDKFKQMSTSFRALHDSATGWSHKGHEAIIALNHVLGRATNDAQGVLFSDSLRFNQAIKGNLQDETAKMEALALDQNARLKIIKEHGNGSRLLLPEEFPENPDKMLGKNVMCNSNYQGVNQDLVHYTKGVITSFVPSVNKWRIKLKSHNAKAFMPVLRRDEFEMLDGEELDGIEIGKTHKAGHNAEWVAKMETYGKKQVLIDHKPDHIKENVIHKTGKVVDYRHEEEYPEFQVEVEGDEDDEIWRPWLVLDRDFHLVEALKGQTVQVNKPHEQDSAGKVTQPGVKAEGVVQDWHKEDGGYYTVKIPERVVKVQPEQLKRERTSWGADPITGKDMYLGKAPPDNALVGAKVSFTDHVENTQKSGEIISYTAGDKEQPTLYEVCTELDEDDHSCTGDKFDLQRSSFVIKEVGNRATRFQHGAQKLLGRVVLFDPTNKGAPGEEDAFLGIVKSQPGEQSPEHTYMVLGDDDKQYEMNYNSLKLVHGNLLENMKVSFKDPSAKPEDQSEMTGAIVKYDKGDDLYKVTDSTTQKAYQLTYDDFTVSDFPGKAKNEYMDSRGGILPVGPELLNQKVKFTIPDRVDHEGKPAVFEGEVQDVEPKAEGRRPFVYTYTMASESLTGSPKIKQNQISELVRHPSEVLESSLAARRKALTGESDETSSVHEATDSEFGSM